MNSPNFKTNIGKTRLPLWKTPQWEKDTADDYRCLQMSKSDYFWRNSNVHLPIYILDACRCSSVFTDAHRCLQMITQYQSTAMHRHCHNLPSLFEELNLPWVQLKGIGFFSIHTTFTFTIIHHTRYELNPKAIDYHTPKVFECIYWTFILLL